MNINEASWEQLKKDVGDEIFPTIVGSLVKEIMDRKQLLSAAIAAQDVAQIGHEAHSLKSTARTIGLDTVADSAQSAESAAREGSSEAAMSNAKELHDYLDTAADLLQQRLDMQ